MLIQIDDDKSIVACFIQRLDRRVVAQPAVIVFFSVDGNTAENKRDGSGRQNDFYLFGFVVIFKVEIIRDIVLDIVRGTKTVSGIFFFFGINVLTDTSF